jgi:hypothetical protein
MVVSRHGWPVAWCIFPGNTADVRALEMMVSRLRKRLQVSGVVLVGDLGMISGDAIELLIGYKKAPFDYAPFGRSSLSRTLSRAGHDVAIWIPRAPLPVTKKAFLQPP